MYRGAAAGSLRRPDAVPERQLRRDERAGAEGCRPAEREDPADPVTREPGVGHRES